MGSSVRVRRIGLAWVLVGSFAEWPGARAVHLELGLPLDAFGQSNVGWLAVAPPEAGTLTGVLRWEDDSGGRLGTLELPPLYEMLDSGPTWYGPSVHE